MQKIFNIFRHRYSKISCYSISVIFIKHEIFVTIFLLSVVSTAL